MHHISRIIASLATAALLVGCGDSNTANTSGTLNLSVTDAPIDGAAHVWVEFTGVELKPQSGPAFSIDFGAGNEKQIDLLSLQGSSSEPLISNQDVAAGNYNWVRLKVNAQSNTLDSYIELNDGWQFSLWIPGGGETGLKLIRGFTITSGGVSNLTIDFDLRKSITAPTAFTDYYLKPALKIVDNSEVGQISGTVSADFFSDPNCSADASASTGAGAAVYLYSDANATTGDSGSANEPLSSVLISLNTTRGELEYEFGFVDAGEYTLALTCEASDDDPEAINNISFNSQENITVVLDETTVHDFEIPAI